MSLAFMHPFMMLYYFSCSYRSDVECPGELLTEHQDPAYAHLVVESDAFRSSDSVFRLRMSIGPHRRSGMADG